LIFIVGFERPGRSLSAPPGARVSDSNESALRSGMSRLHEHLDFTAETLGAIAPASIARPACSSTRCIVPDNPNKFGAVAPVPASIPDFLLKILPAAAANPHHHRHSLPGPG